MQRLLPLLSTRLTNGQIALWLTSSNPDLNNRRPADLLASEAEAVWRVARASMLSA